LSLIILNSCISDTISAKEFCWKIGTVTSQHTGINQTNFCPQLPYLKIVILTQQVQSIQAEIYDLLLGNH